MEQGQDPLSKSWSGKISSDKPGRRARKHYDYGSIDSGLSNAIGYNVPLCDCQGLKMPWAE